MFVTLEGPEGAGKSTAARALADWLTELGRDVTLTREPGGSPIGPQVREMLLHQDELDPWSEVFLFLADRSLHVRTKIKPALSLGHVVICDRYADSTLVYQGHARGLPVGTLRELNHLATAGVEPHLTLLFDLPVEIGLARLTNPDRLDAEPIEFHQAVRKGFLKEASLSPSRWRIIDASAPPEEVRAACQKEILPMLRPQ